MNTGQPKQTQATPGPWTVVHDEHSDREIVADLVNDTWVAAAPGQQLGDWMADARLIAAAPDLLAALQRLDRIERGLEAWHEDARAEAWQQARAALAKATKGA